MEKYLLHLTTSLILLVAMWSFNLVILVNTKIIEIIQFILIQISEEYFAFILHIHPSKVFMVYSRINMW